MIWCSISSPTIAQCQALFEVLGERAVDAAVDAAVEIDVAPAAVLPRLAARRVCQDCGGDRSSRRLGAHHLACPACGGIARRRDDDTDEAIARPLALYDEEGRHSWRGSTATISWSPSTAPDYPMTCSRDWGGPGASAPGE